MSRPLIGLKWRRDKVFEYCCKDKNREWIADKLQLSVPTIDRDIRYLKKDAGVTDWLDRKLPWECNKAVITYDMLASKMWDIVDDDNIEPKVRVMAGHLIANVTDKKISMLGGRDTLKRTVTFITRLKQQNKIPRFDTTKWQRNNSY